MKKPNLVLTGAILLFSITTREGHAQSARGSFVGSSAVKAFLAGKAGESASSVTKGRAMINFKKDYNDATGVEWTILADGSLVCRFYRNNILYRAFYTQKGRRTACVSGYDAGRLDKNIYDKIKMVYYNSSIVYVNQVDLVNGKTFYIVEVQDAKTIKKLRVDDEGMEVVLELEKN